MIDTTAPQITTPNGSLDATIECSDTDGLDNALNQEPTATDNCATNVVITLVSDETTDDANCANAYVRTRTWTFDDGCGNISDTFTQTITVIDTTAPVLVTPNFDDTLSVQCDAIPEIPDLDFEDNCSADVNVIFNEEINFFPNTDDYEIVRDWTVDDGCGNVANFTQTISVTTPTISSVDGDRCFDDGVIDLFDFLETGIDTTGTWSIVIGNNITINGSFFNPQESDVGEIYTFRYTIGDTCATEVDVNITINDDCVVLPCGEEDVEISNTVTANGDFVNEFFRVTGVETCGFVTEVQIFNRWGAVVYKNNNYQNDWSGQTINSSVGNSGNVPTGTYYYVVTLRNSGLEPFAGPIYVVTDK
ncbi:gliding motility-associated C-terminal domain-containing protein [Winogradskyella sp.]|uniref:gliding motility-associated C-terminal domain-containing protein n=1 Tax=Winogradskyella sp. TaxID=1883156 RepID=UPI0025D56B19|nr:gliding motility-associated C-terminal domain-containing protein [Winogradskyella sp.]